MQNRPNLQDQENRRAIPANLVDLLRARAVYQPSQPAYSFLADGKTISQCFTYAELDCQARAIAAELQSLNCQGERALLLYPPGLEFMAAFFGCLYGGAIAIPAPPPDPARLKHSVPRLLAIAQDAQASFVLTPSRNHEQLKEACCGFSPVFEQMKWMVSDSLPSELAENWQNPSLSADTLAYLQYTSGSTATPKGVMLSHGNLLHHLADISQAWGYRSDSIATTWLPYFHDYGLVDGLLQPLFCGIPCYVMSPLTFYMRPWRWLETISRYRVTHTQAPNFAYEHCLQRITAKQRESLDLSSLHTASNGAEPIRESTISRFLETFAPYGLRPEAFYPSYGLAEATLLVATKPHGQPPKILNLEAKALERGRIVETTLTDVERRAAISCGPPIGKLNLTIVNPTNLTRCPPDEVGEIWVKDASVAQGYWQRPEESQATFGAYLRDTGEGPFLRTGDLGFLHAGELYIAGRIKDVIIIRGRNHYPQDIELTVEQSHPALRVGHGAAFSLEIEEEERLIVVQEVERGQLRQLALREVVGNIREAIADVHELQVSDVVLVEAGSIAKTSSGKIQRSACRIKYLKGEFKKLKPQMTPSSQKSTLQTLA